MGFFGSRNTRTYLRVHSLEPIGFRLFACRGARSENKQMNATPNETVDTSGIDISEHAKLRVQQRLGVIERAAEHVRELLASDAAEPVDVDYVKNAKAYRVGSVTIVLDSDAEVVQTVFEREVRE